MNDAPQGYEPPDRESYEPPAVEEVETHGRPLETAAGGTNTPTVGASKVEELD